MFKKFHAALALLLCEGVTPSDCWRLEREPEGIIEDLKSARGRKRLSDELGKPLGEVRWGRFEWQIKEVGRTGADAVCLWDDEYPDYLRHVSQPPPVLFYKGDFGRVRRRGVAVVGTRKPSPPGAALARSLGRGLSQFGIPVVSGLARGIDSAAHAGGLDGPGGSIAVIGTGLDVPYPPENAGLMVDVSANGCAVTEQWMGGTARAFVFPLRNRLISAMSYAVVVVQAGARSGALITAKWALEQGREVGAVPGFPGDFRSTGVNQLLKQGAFVVEKTTDIIAAVPTLGLTLDVGEPDRSDAATSSASGEGAGEKPARLEGNRDLERVLAAVGSAPAGVDELSALVGMEAAAVQRMLLYLEMSGRVERDCMGRYTKMRL